MGNTGVVSAFWEMPMRVRLATMVFFILAILFGGWCFYGALGVFFFASLEESVG